MKLIDILSLEMKVWPHGYADVGQADFGSLHLPGIGTHDRHTTETYTKADDWMTAIVTREQWQAAVDALNAEKCDHSHGNDHGCPECGEEFAPVWNGEGYPPVGCEIEAMLPALGSSWFWQLAKVVHGPLTESPSEILVFSLENTKPSWVDQFRPIRTAEQIAADERERVCKQLCIDAGSPEQTHYQMLIAYKLYDAGYRKQVAK